MKERKSNSSKRLTSTVSLMPIRKKFCIKREVRMDVVSALSTTKNLADAGIYIDSGTRKGVLLEEGTVVRVDGFGGDLNDEPTAKLSIFPINGRMGQLYVNLEDMDGLVWELYQEPVKKEQPPVKKIEVSLNYPTHTDLILHRAIERGVKWSEIDRTLVNPLALTPEELNNKMFVAESNRDGGSAIYKYGKEVHVYNLRWYYSYYFTLEAPEGGLLHARRSHPALELRIAERTTSSDWEVVVRELQMSGQNYEQMVKDFLKEKHKQ